MRNNKTINIFHNIFIVFLSFAIIFIMCLCSHNDVHASGQTTVDVTSLGSSADINHSCIWASTYNGMQHWEYCTICGAKRNVKNHSYTLSYVGRASDWNNHIYCSPWTQFYNTCSCGYRCKYSTAHTDNGSWRPTYSQRHVHYRYCTTCGTWTASGMCYNDSGDLSCKNPGTCKACGTTVSAYDHYIVNGVCQYCGVRFFTTNNCSISYSSDYSTCTYVYSCTTQNGFSFTSVPCRQSNGSYNESSCDRSMTVNGNTTTFTNVFHFDSSLQRKMTPYFGDSIYGTVNGHSVYVVRISPPNNTAIYQDHSKPSNISVQQTDQQTSNGWATIKKLTITGNDYGGSGSVSVSIKDASNNVVYSGSANLSNHSFSLSCTPAIEANGTKQFTAIVTDYVGNSTTYTFNVSNTDSRGPVWSGTTDYSSTWAQSKAATFKVTDTGVGNVSMAFNDSTNFVTADVNSNSFSRQFLFVGNLYEKKSVKVYSKDSLGNITNTNVTLGYIDSTAPTFSVTKNDGHHVSSVSFSADDKNTKLNKEGSGKTADPSGNYGFYYGYSQTNNSSTATWSSLQTSSTYTVNNLTGGTWYFWVKDYAGNISSVQTLSLKPTFTVTYNANGGSNPPSSGTVAYGDSYHIYSGWDKPTSPYDSKGFNGSALSGWSIDGTDNVAYLPDGYVQNITSDITLTAVWTTRTYNVTYSDEGVAGVTNLPSNEWHVFHGKDYAVSMQVPERTGYQFLGWKCLEDGNVYPGGSVYNTGDSIIKYVHQDLTLVPVWSGKVYFITYDGNGASSGRMNAAIVNYDEDYSIAQTGYVRDNYKFVGWNTEWDGSGTSYSPGQVVRNLASTDSGSVHLYAQWQVDRRSYSLTVNPNGGTYKGTSNTYVSRYWPDPSSTSSYGYAGRVQYYNVEADGYYLIEAWGASGGNDACVGGYGGYVKSYIYLREGQRLAIACGQAGWTLHGADACHVSDATPAFNGGGRAGQTGNNGNYSGVGGGATSVCICYDNYNCRGNGELYNYQNYVDEVIVVAGGGGGGSASNRGIGGKYLVVKNKNGNYSYPLGSSLLCWAFGEGQCAGSHDGGGGGGGFYGGICGWDSGSGNTSGGGASFINNYIGAVSDSSSFTPDCRAGNGFVKISRFENSGMELLELPVRKHYNFTGWTNFGAGTIKQTIDGYSTTIYRANTFAPYNSSASYVCDFSAATTSIQAEWDPYKYNVVYDANAPAGATVTGSVSSQTNLKYDSTYNLRQNSRCCVGTDLYSQIGGYSCVHYHFVEWNTKPDGSGHGFTSGAQIKNLTDYVNPDAPDNYTVTLYAIWESSARTVHYDKNSDYAVLHGNSSEIVYHCPDGSVDTCHTHHYTTRIGWDFLGWGANSESTTTYADSESGLKIGDNDITLYAIHGRDLTMVLADDVVGKINALSYRRYIYNHESHFYYNDTDFTSGTTRVSGDYVVTFANNGNSVISNMGNTSYSDGSIQSTNLTSNNTIIAYPTFRGWYSQPYKAGDYLGTYPGSLIGTSATDVTVTIDNNNGNKYIVDGNANGDVTLYSNNRTLYMYAQWNRTQIILPNATRNTDKHGVNGTDEDLFLGWFTKPQLSSDTTDGGTYVGKAGDLVWIDRDITLYPWFNVAPTVTQSEAVNNFDNPSDSADNLFWEGESISYTQLLTLINAVDDDNHYAVTNSDGTIEWNGLNSWKDIYALNIEVYLNTYLKENYPEYSSAERTAFINDVMSRLSTYQNNYNGDNSDDVVDFEPYITGITYYCDGTDSYGNVVPNSGEWTQSMEDIKANGLNTDVKNIGKIVIHYEITDNGTFDYYNDKYVWTSNGYRVNSPITVKFDLTTQIRFDEAPDLTLTSAVIYANDPSHTSENISQYLIDKQEVADYEDDYNNSPWWVANSSDSSLAYVTDTRNSLVNSKTIVKIKNIVFQTGFERDYPELVAQIQSIDDIKDLFKLKESSNADEVNAFYHITNFDAVMDATDQWGKTASTDRCGQSETDRTFHVIMFNDDDDNDIDNGAIDERLRYIDSDWVDTLDSSSYWASADYGRDSLTTTFTNYLYKNGLMPDLYEGSVVNETVNNSSREVHITVNDYTSQ